MRLCGLRWGFVGMAALVTLGAGAPQSVRDGAEPLAHEARLLLALEMGAAPDQPGFAPGRVGGVAPRGPLAVAVDGASQVAGQGTTVQRVDPEGKPVATGLIPGGDLAEPVNAYTAPQPLEQPFPRYRLSMGAQAWVGYQDLRGDYLLPEPGTLAGTAAYVSGIADLLHRWLPVPDLTEGSVAHLYLAERLEIGEGQDLTRWKSTVVRHLLGVEGAYREAVNLEPFTLIFYVQGKPRVVAVDAEGFTYAGQRFERTGLTDLVLLQGVP